MIVTATDIKNNFGKYLDLASGQDIIITRNGNAIARLVGIKETASFLSDRLVGIVPKDIDEKAVKDERLAQK